MICPKCGKEIQDNARFCTSCGAKLEADDKAVKTVEPEKKPTAKQKQSGKSNRKKWVWLLPLFVLVLVGGVLIGIGIRNADAGRYAKAVSQDGPILQEFAVDDLILQATDKIMAEEPDDSKGDEAWRLAYQGFLTAIMNRNVNTIQEQFGQAYDGVDEFWTQYDYMRDMLGMEEGITFALFYLNDDAIPELLIEGAGAPIVVTYWENAVWVIQFITDDDTYYVPALEKDTYGIIAGEGLVTVGGVKIGGDWMRVFQFDGSPQSTVKDYIYADNSGSGESEINGKSVTAKKAGKRIDKYFKKQNIGAEPRVLTAENIAVVLGLTSRETASWQKAYYDFLLVVNELDMDTIHAQYSQTADALEEFYDQNFYNPAAGILEYEPGSSSEQVKFSLFYLDNDDIPELCIDGDYSAALFKYQDNAIIPIRYSDEGIFTWSYNYNDILGIVERQGFIVSIFGLVGTDCHIYQYDGGNCNEFEYIYAEDYGYQDDEDICATIDGESVTLGEAKTEIEKYKNMITKELKGTWEITPETLQSTLGI